jgi:outer membrane protein assembly factor BamE (lipoprotein component of BamABCDE complex)
MRIGVIVMFAACLLTGCAHLEFNQTVRQLEQIQRGDTRQSVVEKLGPPDMLDEINTQRAVAYYQTSAGPSSQAPVTKEMCTAVAYEFDQVVAVGDDPSERWKQEEAERLKQAEIAERERKAVERAEAARRQAEAARQEKIRALEEEVRPVPASNAALNLKLYRQLLALDPDQPRYRKKVDFYENRLEQQKKARQVRSVRKAKEKQRQAWEQARETRNHLLRQYTGNQTAEMAVHDMGKGTLYVWVKNVSGQIFTTHPDHFTLLDRDDNRARCDISSSLDSVLEPGSISHGKIQYDADVFPKELIFQNQIAGRISKSLE